MELHLLDTGHFALEDKADEMVPLIRDFLERRVARSEARGSEEEAAPAEGDEEGRATAGGASPEEGAPI